MIKRKTKIQKLNKDIYEISYIELSLFGKKYELFNKAKSIEVYAGNHRITELDGNTVIEYIKRG